MASLVVTSRRADEAEDVRGKIPRAEGGVPAWHAGAWRFA